METGNSVSRQLIVSYVQFQRTHQASGLRKKKTLCHWNFIMSLMNDWNLESMIHNNTISFLEIGSNNTSTVRSQKKRLCHWNFMISLMNDWNLESQMKRASKFRRDIMKFQAFQFLTYQSSLRAFSCLGTIFRVFCVWGLFLGPFVFRDFFMCYRSSDHCLFVCLGTFFRVFCV